MLHNQDTEATVLWPQIYQAFKAIRKANPIDGIITTVNIFEQFADRMNWDFIFAHLDNVSDDFIIRFGYKFQNYFRLHFIFGIPIEYVQRVKTLTNLPDII